MFKKENHQNGSKRFGGSTKKIETTAGRL